MTPEHAVFAAVLICLAGALVTLCASRSRALAGWLAFAVTVGTAGLVLWAAATVLLHGASAQPVRFWDMPAFGFALRLHVDGLTAVYLTLAAVIAVPAALYSIAYMRHYQDYGVARYYPYFLVFLAAMYGLVSTTDMMWFFLIFWQMMTLPGYALIRFEHRNHASVVAAWKYLVMMQVACALTMVGAAIVATAGSSAAGRGLEYDFFSVSANLPALLSGNALLGGIAFGLFLLGFGIKMGMWPFGQVWLPDAHPAAPSPVSAMLSGVMIKTGVYGLMRYMLWLVPARGSADYPIYAWGLLVVLLGTVTLFTGTMQALRQEQSKRLLAFHSIGQVGYILLGTGICMVLLSSADLALQDLAVIGLFGALFHVLNHGLFKALLFLNAGSVLYSTGTQDLNRVGGLMKYMPVTAVTAFIASLSIAGVPLFNGFASKWSIYVAGVQGTAELPLLALCTLVAILTSALTLASFVKFAGATFLSRTSALVAERARSAGRLEVGALMQAPQVALAAACVLLGMFPAAGAWFIWSALGASRHGLGVVLAEAAPMARGAATGLVAPGGGALFVPLALAATLTVLFLLAYGLSRVGGAARRAAAPWLCGYAREADCHRYSAHSFYGEVKRYFGWLGGAHAADGRAAHPDGH